MNAEKPVNARNVPSPSERSRNKLPQEEVAARAERLWHERSRPSGQDGAIWLEAESQLQGEMESKPVAGTESRPYVDEPAQPVRAQTKSRDPADAAAQTRSATEAKSNQSAGKWPK